MCGENDIIRRMLNRFVIILVVVSIGVMVLPGVSCAQMNLPKVDVPYALSNELGIGFIPNYPRPNETVFVNLELYTADLNSADITWYQNGKAVLSGKGETRYSFKAGPVGEETKIEIRIRLLDGTSFSKSFSLTPASVDIVWEAYSYVPPFYKGKALHPKQGVLKLVAMPEFVKNSKRVSPENLIYTWSNAVKSYQDQSGYGKRTLTLDGSLLGRTESIKVLVTDPVNNLVAQGFIDISPVDPQIVFYESNPYYGYIFDSAIVDTFDLKTEEAQILATPYYLTMEKDGLIKYEWRLNSQIIPNLSGSRTATFKRPEKETGKSSVSLRIENANRILQQADSSLTMTFEE